MTSEERRELLKRVTVTPGILGGKPIIRGMRISRNEAQFLPFTG